MLSRDQILTPIADAFFAVLKFFDAVLGRAAVGEISAQELWDLQVAAGHPPDEFHAEFFKPDLLIVDVRSDKEISISMIPGAIKKTEFEMKQIVGASPTVILYCTLGGRSYLYARKLTKRGFNTRNLKPGIVGWCNAKLPLVDLDGRSTNKVYIADRSVVVPDDYEVVRDVS